MNGSIELYLVSGFLGSGKTTFLRNLLKETHGKKIGVIVNEFGSVGVDGKLLDIDGIKITEVTGGSIFCACLKGEFVKTLIAYSSFPIDALFVEASGMADPFGMENLLSELRGLNKSADARVYDYKGSVCLVDSVNFLDYNEVFVSAAKQIEKSGLILLNKTDLVDTELLAETKAAITEINKDAYILETTYGKIPFGMFAEKINPQGSMNCETTNRCDNRPASYILYLDETYDTEAMRSFMTEVSAKAVRIKGFFRGAGKVPYLAEYAGSEVTITETPDTGSSDRFCLVIIGGSTEVFEDTIKTAWARYFPAAGFDCVFDS